MLYGIYLCHSSVPLFTGTRRACRAYVDECLTDAERLHGWTIAPVPEPRRPLAPARPPYRAWALLGLGLIFVVLFIGCMALTKGHMQ